MGTLNICFLRELREISVSNPCDFIKYAQDTCMGKITNIIRELVKEYFVIILGQFSPVLHKNIRCGYSLEVPLILIRSASVSQLRYSLEVPHSIKLIPQCTFLCRKKKIYPGIITIYSQFSLSWLHFFTVIEGCEHI